MLRPTDATTVDRPDLETEGGQWLFESGPGLPDEAERPVPQAVADTIWRALMGLVLTAGALAQAHVWILGRGLWVDELAIALNLRDRTAGQLLGPLLGRQVAPVGWILTEKALWTAFGDDERVLRLPSLIAMLLVLALTAVLACRLLGRWGGLLATAMVAVSPATLFYVEELKQYSVEAAVLLVLLVTADQWGRRAMTWRDRCLAAVVWAFVGTVGVFVSFTGVLVLAGIAAGLGLYLVIHRRWPDILAFSLGSLSAFAVGAALILRRLSQPMAVDQDLVFPTGMPPRGSGPAEVAQWLPRMWSALVSNPLHWRFPVVVLLLALTGLVYLVIHRPRNGLMFVGIFGAALLAAAVRQYPMAGRVAVYLVPALLIVLVAGVVEAMRALMRTVISPAWQPPARRVAVFGALLGGLLVGAVTSAAPSVKVGFDQAIAPQYRDQGREVLRDVAPRMRAGDVVIYYRYSTQLGHWYGPKNGMPDRWEALMEPRRADGSCDLAGLDAALKGARRVWWVHGALLVAHPRGYNEWVAAILASRGRVADMRTFSLTGSTPTLGNRAGWLLVDLSAGADPDPPQASQDQRFACLKVSPVS